MRGWNSGKGPVSELFRRSRCVSLVRMLILIGIVPTSELEGSLMVVTRFDRHVTPIHLQWWVLFDQLAGARVSAFRNWFMKSPLSSTLKWAMVATTTIKMAK